MFNKSCLCCFCIVWIWNVLGRNIKLCSIRSTYMLLLLWLHTTRWWRVLLRHGIPHLQCIQSLIISSFFCSCFQRNVIANHRCILWRCCFSIVPSIKFSCSSILQELENLHLRLRESECQFCQLGYRAHGNSMLPSKLETLTDILICAAVSNFIVIVCTEFSCLIQCMLANMIHLLSKRPDWVVVIISVWMMVDAKSLPPFFDLVVWGLRCLPS